MKKHLFLFLLAYCPFTWAQNSGYRSQIENLTDQMWKHYYYEKDSTYFVIDEIYTLAIKNKDRDTQIDALLNYCGVSNYHYDLEKSHDKLKELDSILSLPTYQESENYATNQNTLLYYKGVQFLKLYEYRKSRGVFERIISNVENTPISSMNSDLLELASVATSFIGKIHLEEGKYDLAKQYYEKDIRNIVKNTPEKTEYIYDNYNLLAEVFKEEKKYSAANSYLLKTYGYNKSKKNINSTISSAFNLSQNYNHLNQKDSALFYLAEAKSNFNDNPTFTWRYHLVKSEINKKNLNLEMAYKELNLAIKKAQLKTKNPQNLQIIIARTEIGKIKFLQNQYKEAIQSFDLGLKELKKIPAARTVKLKLLKNKSNALNALANDDSYIESIQVLDTGIVTLDSLKPSFKSENDKLFLIEDAFPLFESGLEAAFKLYGSTKDEKYIDLAFNYSEKSKSVLLMEALLASKATEFANIPVELLENEKQLKAEITHVEKQLNNAQDDSSLHDKLFDLKNEHRNLINTIETKYRSYYDLKYNSEVISISEAQQLLINDEVLVSYFYGNDAIYVITLTNNSKQLFAVNVNENLDSKISEIHSMMSDPKSDASVLAQKTKTLYKLILEPALVSTEKKKLIVIADGLLNYIPFGALNTVENGITYLVENKSVAYSNSATLLRQLRDKPIANPNILAFAPSFENSGLVDEISKKLLPLPHNIREVEQIMTSFEGRPFLGNNASLTNFASEISDFGIVHLATHAIFDDASPEYSYLAFSPKENEDYLLYVRDLYNMQLNADLVTLSACETSVGELKRGEGFMGLARGFFYGGASSISSTLWKINDASSTQLMDSFYKNLADGEAKDLALQKAQKAFLETNNQNALSHPYYWSGFVISGNTNPLVNKADWMFIFFGSLLVFGGVYMVYRKKVA